jgi:hypothetical protein
VSITTRWSSACRALLYRVTTLTNPKGGARCCRQQSTPLRVAPRKGEGEGEGEREGEREREGKNGEREGKNGERSGVMEVEKKEATSLSDVTSTFFQHSRDHVIAFKRDSGRDMTRHRDVTGRDTRVSLWRHLTWREILCLTTCTVLIRTVLHFLFAFNQVKWRKSAHHVTQRESKCHVTQCKSARHITQRKSVRRVMGQESACHIMQHESARHVASFFFYIRKHFILSQIQVPI